MGRTVPWSVPIMKSSMQPELMGPSSWELASLRIDCGCHRVQPTSYHIKNSIRGTTIAQGVDRRRRGIPVSFQSLKDSVAASLNDFEEPPGVFAGPLGDFI